MWRLEYKKYHSFNNTIMPGEIVDARYDWQKYYYLTPDEFVQVKAETKAYIDMLDVASTGLVYNGRHAGKKFRCIFTEVYSAEKLYEQILIMEENRFGKLYGRMVDLINLAHSYPQEFRSTMLMLPQNMVQLMQDSLTETEDALGL